MKHILLFAITILSLTSYGQKKTDTNIVGDVKDIKTGEHIPFINVTINNTVIGTTTDATGHYFLKNLPTGTFTMRVSGVGYKTVEKEVVLESGKTIEVNFMT